MLLKVIAETEINGTKYKKGVVIDISNITENMVVAAFGNENEIIKPFKSLLMSAIRTHKAMKPGVSNMIEIPLALKEEVEKFKSNVSYKSMVVGESRVITESEAEEVYGGKQC